MDDSAARYPRRANTERLDLRAVQPDDLTALHVLHADASTWRHFPSGRHTDVEETRQKLASMIERWDTDGLGYWSVRIIGDPAATIVGIGGAQVAAGGYWNVYYRFAPSAWGFGYAAEVGALAVRAAREQDPDRPIVASLLAHNLASRRTAERIGLTLRTDLPQDPAWPDGPHRLIFADRDVPDSISAAAVGD